MSPSDRIVKVEMLEIERYVALGLGRYEAIKAVEAGLDQPGAESGVSDEGSPDTFTPSRP